jgi:hypothetical protein
MYYCTEAGVTRFPPIACGKEFLVPRNSGYHLPGKPPDVRTVSDGRACSSDLSRFRPSLRSFRELHEHDVKERTQVSITHNGPVTPGSATSSRDWAAK